MSLYAVLCRISSNYSPAAASVYHSVSFCASSTVILSVFIMQSIIGPFYFSPCTILLDIFHFHMQLLSGCDDLLIDSKIVNFSATNGLMSNLIGH